MWLRTEWRRCLYDGMLFRRSRDYWQTWSFNMINIDMVLPVIICFRESQPKLAPHIKCIIVIVVNFNMVNFYHHSKFTLLIISYTYMYNRWYLKHYIYLSPFSAFIPLQLHSAFDQCIQLSLCQCLDYNWIHSPVITPYLYQRDS